MKWSVDFESPLLLDLEQQMLRGYIVELAEERADGKELVFIQKAAVGMLGGLVMQIYADEHPPPHFHVRFNGQENSFRIDDGNPLHPDGDLKKWFKTIKKWHRENRASLIESWNRLRPSDCPVGVMT